MRVMKQKNLCKKNDGFTLVEVVVVVVILVILATIGIPAYTKYFKSTYNEKVLKETNDILECSQIIIDELYAAASHSDEDTCIISGKNNDSCNPYKKVNDSEIDLHKNELAAQILSMAGYNIKFDDPCAVALGIGSYSEYAIPEKSTYDVEKAYQIYYIMIWPYYSGKAYILRADSLEKLESKSIFVDENEFVNNKKVKFLSFKDARATKCIIVDGKLIKTQLYYIKNGKGNDRPGNEMWDNITKKIN